MGNEIKKPASKSAEPTPDKVVREKATELLAAIITARQAGYRVDWPRYETKLGQIAVSSGRKAV